MLQTINSPFHNPVSTLIQGFHNNSNQISHGSVAISTLLGGHKRSSHSTSNPSSPLRSPTVSLGVELALKSKISELVNLVSANNKELTTLRLENNTLKEKIAEIELTNANRTTTIANGICSLVQYIKTLPDVFSCVQEWVSYSDVKFLEHVEEFGAGELVNLIRDILDKTHQFEIF